MKNYFEKKKLFKPIAILMTMITLFTIFIIPTSAYNERVYEITDEIHLGYEYSFSTSVNDEVLETYIRQKLKNFASYIDLSAFNILQSDAPIIGNLVFDDIPESFHVKELHYTANYGKVLNLLVTYNCTPEEYTIMLNECTTSVNKILTGIKNNNNISSVEKALLVHDRLAVLCEYDNENLINNTIPKESYTMYGALSKKIAVCQGYAEAYKYILNIIGINCRLCKSKSLNHTWNIVEINNKEYHVDVTWDDAVNDITGRVNHQNFLLSSNAIYNSGHRASDYDNSPKDTAFDNAFWKNSTAEFQLINNELYYIDHSSKEIKTYSNKQPLLSIDTIWYAANGDYWLDNFARLSSDGVNLLYSLNDGVYKYNLSTNEQSTVWKPTMPAGEEFNVFGFTLSDGYLICDINNSPNFSFSTKENYQQKKLYESPVCDGKSHHISTVILGVAPTCTKSGLTNGEKCSVCGFVIVKQMPIPATGHSYTTQVIPADCKNKGYTKHTCTACGDSYNSDYIEITGHSTNNGLCTGCNSYIVEEGHNLKLSFSSAVEISNVSWQVKNNTVTIIDSGCNVIDADSAGKKLYEYYAVVSGAEKGENEVYVLISGISITKDTITILPHTTHLPVDVKGKSPSCTTDGLTDGSKCSYCEKILKKQEIIPATGHTPGGWQTIPASEGGIHGYLYKKCTVCKKILESKHDDSYGIIFGDVNDDGKITAADARLALRISAHLDTPNEKQLITADYDRNGKITAADARMILRKSANLS
jgi:hypothetical protein